MSDEPSSPEPNAFAEGCLRLDAGLDELQQLTRDGDGSDAARARRQDLLDSLDALVRELAVSTTFRSPEDPLAVALAVRRNRVDALAARVRHLDEPNAAPSAAVFLAPTPEPDAAPEVRSDVDADEEPPVEPSVGEQLSRLWRSVRPASRTSRMMLTARIVTFVGMLFGLFIIYEVWFTGISADRDQHVLLREFKQSLREQAGRDLAGGDGDDSGVLTGGDPDEAAPADRTEAPPPPSLGDPVAILTIPRLDLELVVVEGSGAAQTMGAPGHVRSTPMPGERGNAAIVGRRTTYGAQFQDLDQLRAGDRIVTTTQRGAFRYKVADRVRADSDDDEDPFTPKAANRLTLVTSAPEFAASERLVVRAELMGDPIPAPPLNDRGGTIDDDEDGITPNWAAIPGAVVWLQLLVVVFLIALVLYRRWLRWPTYLLTTPLLLALLMLAFDSCSKLLPSTL